MYMIIWRLTPLSPSTWSDQIIPQHWCQASGALQSETQTCFTCSRTTISHSWLSFRVSFNDSQAPPSGAEAVKQTHPPLRAIAPSTLASLAVPDFDARQIWFCLEYTDHLNACLVCEKKRESARSVFFFFFTNRLQTPSSLLCSFLKHTHTFARWHKRTHGTCRQQAGPDVQR